MQNLGIDIGRGCLKAYSEYEGKELKCLFTSVVANATTKEKDLEVYFNEENESKSVYFSAEILGQDSFKHIYCGEIAEKEGYTPTQNVSDSKVTQEAKKLLIGALSKIAIAPEVNIMLGVPNRDYRKSVLSDVVNTYKGKEIYIENNFTKEVKKIKIVNISIAKESDSALLYEIATNNPNNDKDFAMVNIGYRTMEIAFYNNDLSYNNRLSISEPLGNSKILEQVKDELSSKKIYKNLYEIDNSKRYDDIKERAYEEFSHGLNQLVEGKIENLSEVNLYICGGISGKLKVRKEFKKVNDPQMITAKGLWLKATQTFKSEVDING